MGDGLGCCTARQQQDEKGNQTCHDSPDVETELRVAVAIAEEIVKYFTRPGVPPSVECSKK
jgi:hypothetical protein